MEVSYSNVKPRIFRQDVKLYGILGYGVDNLYPQTVDLVVENSGRGTSCVKALSKFISGLGFVDEAFGKSVINNDGETVNQLLRKVSNDMALHGGRAYLLKYNPFGEINEVFHIPYEWCRLGIGDGKGGATDYKGQIAVYNNWDRQTKDRITKTDITWYDTYNPAKALEQIELVGLGNFKGQILYEHGSKKNVYGLAPVDAELESCVSDGQIKLGHFSNLITGFMNTTMITFAETLDDPDRDRVNDNFEKLQGAENAGKVIIFDGIRKEDLVVSNLSSEKSEQKDTEESIRERIRELFNVPPVLVGVVTNAFFGESGKVFTEAKKYYSDVTAEERMIVESDFFDLFSIFAFDINPTNDYTIQTIGSLAIQELSIDEVLDDLSQNERRGAAGFDELADVEASESLLIEKIGVGGTQALIAILADPATSAEQKSSTLQILFGLTKEDADTMAGITNG